jgi:hypothetical protein
MFFVISSLTLYTTNVSKSEVKIVRINWNWHFFYSIYVFTFFPPELRENYPVKIALPLKVLILGLRYTAQVFWLARPTNSMLGLYLFCIVQVLCDCDGERDSRGEQGDGVGQGSRPVQHRPGEAVSHITGVNLVAGWYFQMRNSEQETLYHSVGTVLCPCRHIVSGLSILNKFCCVCRVPTVSMFLTAWPWLTTGTRSVWRTGISGS